MTILIIMVTVLPCCLTAYSKECTFPSPVKFIHLVCHRNMGKSMQPIFISKCKLVLSTSPVDVVFNMLLIMNISAGFLPASL